MVCWHNHEGFRERQQGSKKLQVFSTVKGEYLLHEFTLATEKEIEEAATKAMAAFAVYKKTTSA